MRETRKTWIQLYKELCSIYLDDRERVTGMSDRDHNIYAMIRLFNRLPDEEIENATRWMYALEYSYRKRKGA